MKKKVLALTICLAMIAIAVIGGTLAYFTDQTDPVENTLTVGDVSIELEEPSWQGDDHTLMPGVGFAKDPTITVLEGSQTAWVFLDVKLEKSNELFSLMWLEAKANPEGQEVPGTLDAFKTKLLSTAGFRENIVNRWIVGINHDNWKSYTPSEENNNTTLRFGLKYTLDANSSVKFMERIQMPTTVTSDMITDLGPGFSDINISFRAYAVQAVGGVDTLDEAYGIMFSTTP